eukprot:gene34602-42681_t
MSVGSGGGRETPLNVPHTPTAAQTNINNNDPNSPQGIFTPPKLTTKDTDEGFKSACKIALDKAVECGREISAVCGNHKVQLTQKAVTVIEKTATTPTAKSSAAKIGGTSMFRMILPSLGTTLSMGSGGGGGTPLSPVKEGPALTSVVAAAVAAADEDNVAYLNVHSGVSMGLMAGIDIGAND